MSKGISLDKFAKGALRAQFNRELSRVASNIWDPNTSATAKRAISITINIKPDENRELGQIEIQSKSTTCPVKSVTTQMIFGYDESKGQGVANELNAEMLGQVDLEELENSVRQQQEEQEIEMAEKVIDLRTKIS